MARNATLPLHGDDLDRAEFYFNVVSGFLNGDGSTVAFRYTKRDGTVSEREAVPTEVVGVPATTSHGFKGETPDGPRTFNFHLMG